MNKAFSSQNYSARLRIRAAVADFPGQPDRDMIFRPEQIDHLFSIDDSHAAIALQNGAIIPVAQSLDALDQAIYSPDFKNGDVVDLRPWTGSAADGGAATLLTAFNKSALPFILAAEQVSRGNANMTLRFFFAGDVKYFEPHIDKPGDATYVHLHNGQSFYIDVPPQKLQKTFEQAQSAQRGFMNLLTPRQAAQIAQIATGEKPAFKPAPKR